VSDRPTENTPRGWRRALYQWLIGPETSDGIAPPPTSASAAQSVPTRIDHYLIDRKIGEGGMGVVYAARDERLERLVALKLMSSLAGGDDTARQRFWREARAAASVNHPNVCQIHEIGEDAGTLFIAMSCSKARRWPTACAVDRCAFPK
jgi:serine/threonine protein kinase